MTDREFQTLRSRELRIHLLAADFLALVFVFGLVFYLP